MPERIAQLCGTRPLRVLARAAGAQLSAARWRFNGLTPQARALDELVLGCRTSGTATIVRSTAQASVRKRPVLGAVSLLNPAQNAEWLIDGACEVIHVYIPRPALQEFSRKAFGSDLSHRVRDFVGVRSRAFAAYFQMLAAEIEWAAANGDAADSRFLAETQGLLMRRLIGRWSWVCTTRTTICVPDSARSR